MRILPQVFLGCLSLLGAARAQNIDAFMPQFVPQPAAETHAPYLPQALMPGGVVIPIWPEGSPMLNAERVHEAEDYQMDPVVPGRVRTLTNVHNPSIEVHPVPRRQNTGAAIIIIAGGGNKRLFVGGESCDIVSYLFNYGVTGIILRHRLRADGYVAEVDSVNDTLQAIRLVRRHAEVWGIDPNRIGVMGFSAGGEQASGAALGYPDFDRTHDKASDALAGISSRPDFVSLVYTGPSALTLDPTTSIPEDVPPVFIASASYGDKRHTIWSIEYYRAMLNRGVPNIELHLYGNGGHGGGISDRGGIPFGSWEDRFVDWIRDLGFLQNPGLPTRAAHDVATHVSPQK
ncbi:MAG: alpha/beta hydrolase [Synoicihabitans sp.]